MLFWIYEQYAYVCVVGKEKFAWYLYCIGFILPYVWCHVLAGFESEVQIPKDLQVKVIRRSDKAPFSVCMFEPLWNQNTAFTQSLHFWQVIPCYIYHLPHHYKLDERRMNFHSNLNYDRKIVCELDHWSASTSLHRHDGCLCSGENRHQTICNLLTDSFVIKFCHPAV